MGSAEAVTVRQAWRAGERGHYWAQSTRGQGAAPRVWHRVTDAPWHADILLPACGNAVLRRSGATIVFQATAPGAMCAGCRTVLGWAPAEVPDGA